MAKIDMKRLRLYSTTTGARASNSVPLVPAEWAKQTKHLQVWQLGMITSLRSALIKWSDKA